MEPINFKTIHKDIVSLKKAVDEIRKNMIGADMILSESDKIAVTEYQKEKEEGKLVSLSGLKNALNL